MSIIKIRENAVKRVMGPVVALLLVVFVAGIFWSFGSSSPDDIRGGDGSSPIHDAFTLNGRKYDNSTYLAQRTFFQQIRQQRMGNQALTVSELAQFKSSLIPEIIGEHILADAAEKEGLRATRGEMNDELNKAVKQRLDMLKMEAFGQDGAKKSDEELDAHMKSVGVAGVSEIENQMRSLFNKDTLRLIVLSKKYQEKVRGKIQLNDQSLKDSYKAATVRHILVSSEKNPEATSKRKAEEILAKLKSGGDFAKLAKEFSDDPGSKQNGGLLPTPVSPVQTMYDPDFASASLQLKNPGDISGLVKSRFGYHIIKLEKVVYNLPKDFDKKKEEYRKQQTENIANLEWSKVVDKLRKEADISFIDPEFEGYWLMAKFNMERDSKYLPKIVEAFQRHLIKQQDNQDSFSSYIMLAQAQSALNKNTDAINTLLKGLERFEDATVRIQLANMMMQAGQKQKALEQYKTASETTIDPNVHMQLHQVFSSVFPNKELAAKSQDILTRAMERQRSLQRSAAPPAPEKKKTGQPAKTAH